MSTKAQLVGSLASLSLLVVSVGCAVGSEVDTDVMEGTLASTPIEADAGEDDGVKLPPPSQPGADAGTTDASTPKTDAGGDAGTPPPPPPGGSCVATAPCTSAGDLGTVSGDTGADSLSAQGSTSQWFRVMVNENDNAVGGVKLRATATLVSPPGTNFDLYLYSGSSSAQECSAVAAQSTSSSGTDTASVSFGEGGLLANGNNDSRYVTVEVRHVSGPCASNAKWSLTFSGNN